MFLYQSFDVFSHSVGVVETYIMVGHKGRHVVSEPLYHVLSDLDTMLLTLLAVVRIVSPDIPLNSFSFNFRRSFTASSHRQSIESTY